MERVSKNSNEILDAFKKYKLKDAETFGDVMTEDGGYFAKYLTSGRIFELQLNNSNFRQRFLVQLLILFQYLNADVKFKSNNQAMDVEQCAWIKQAKSKVYKILKKLPPNGKHFALSMKNIFERENIWNKWKNEGCPNFFKEKQPEGIPKKLVERTLTSNFMLGSNNYISGDSELMKLCDVNYNHKNRSICFERIGAYVPKTKEFFEEAIEQLDPENQIEKQYYLIYDSEWAWKAVRLLQRRREYDLMDNQNTKTRSEHLEMVCNKLKNEVTIRDEVKITNEVKIPDEVKILVPTDCTTTMQLGENESQIVKPIRTGHEDKKLFKKKVKRGRRKGKRAEDSDSSDSTSPVFKRVRYQ